MEIVKSIIILLCGLSFFLFGMKIMSGDLEKMTGGKLEKSLKKVTKNPIISIGLGAAITIAMQSSSAITVMIVGLVNSGIMQFSQTLSIIFGANIGTTLTSWILSLSGLEGSGLIMLLKPKYFGPVLAIIGVFMLMLSKKDKLKSMGNVFVGFTLLIYGMEIMQEAMVPIAEGDMFQQFILKFNNPIVALLIGTGFTAIIQGSAASIGILLGLASTGLLTYEMAIPLVMGINIGTCATALISSIGTTTGAKRVAWAHTFVNIISTLVFLPIYFICDAIFPQVSALSVSTIDGFGISLVHSVFNIGATILLMPFKNQLIKLIEFIVKEKKTQPAKSPLFLDKLVLRSPSVAIHECNNYTKEMCDLAIDMLLKSMGILSKYDAEIEQNIFDGEEKLDSYEDGLGKNLVTLAASSLSQEDSARSSKMLHAIGDFERMGDHAVNLCRTAKEIYDKDLAFSPEATEEINLLMGAITEILDITRRCYVNSDVELAHKVEPLEQVIDDITSTIRYNHVQRLQNGKCTIELGFVLSDILMNLSRISDHCSNIAVALIESAHNSFKTHEYLNSVKYGNSEFNELYNEFSIKYSASTLNI